MSFSWDGSELLPQGSTDTQFGRGLWDGVQAQWYFPHESSPFWTIAWDKSRGFLTCTHIGWKDPVHWVFDASQKSLKIDSSVPEELRNKEGLDTEFYQRGGDIPLPVLLFVAMFRRTLWLYEDKVERSRRSYSRCSKFCGAGGNVTPLLCPSCASELDGRCLVCGGSQPRPSIQGRLCKMCQIKKLFCARCGDKVVGQPTTALMCGSPCGLGKDVENCCRLKCDSQNI